MKFSVKLDPISTDIVAHCITLHIIAGPEEPESGKGGVQLTPPDFSRYIRDQPFKTLAFFKGVGVKNLPNLPTHCSKKLRTGGN